MTERTDHGKASEPAKAVVVPWWSLRRPEAVILALAVLVAGAAWTWRFVSSEEPRVIEVGPRVPLDAKVRVNEFEASALTVIPGVGEKLAAAIVEERGRGGRFRDLADMAARVKGFRVSRVGEFEKYLDFGEGHEGAETPMGPQRAD